MSDDMRQEMNGVKSDVKALAAKVENGFGALDEKLIRIDGKIISLDENVCTFKEAAQRTMVAVARIIGDLADIRANMATKTDISALNARMDGFSGLLEDSRRRWAVHADILARHDERLKKLERRRS